MTTDPTPPTDHDAVTLYLDRLEAVTWHPEVLAVIATIRAERVAARLAARDAVPATAQGPGVAEIDVEAFLVAEWHGHICACQGGPQNCASYENGPAPAPWSFPVDEVFRAMAALAAAGQPTTQPAPEAAVQAVLDNHDAIEDFELSDADWTALKRCGCAHCEDGDGICPMTVQHLIKERLCDLRDRVQDALDTYCNQEKP